MQFLNDWMGKWVMEGTQFDVPNVKTLQPDYFYASGPGGAMNRFPNVNKQQAIIVDDVWTGTASSQYKLFTDKEILTALDNAILDNGI